MLNLTEQKLTYNDISIVPSVVSEIEHRDECCPYNEDGMLPIFTAPMDTVVNEENFELFESLKVNVILPRNINIETRLEFSKKGKWAAYSLNEFKEYFCNPTTNPIKEPMKVLIDVANGNMKSMFDAIRVSKSIYNNDIIIMMGNIANPKTYIMCADCGVDYVRCSVGTGDVCQTSKKTAIHYPPVSLIDEIKKLSKSMMDGCSKYDKVPKIIADGGITSYADMIKALAIGADYVMIGRLFAQAEESAAKTTMFNGKLYKNYYGMASRKGKESLGNNISFIEGSEKTIEVKYNLTDFIKGFEQTLKSTMSYVNSKVLKTLYINSNVIVISNNASNIFKS